MPTPQLPGYAASPLTPTGHLSKEWYRYLKWVGERDTSTEADADGTEYKLVGPLSIVVSGLLQNGLASLALKNDQDAPSATSYYGTDDDGTKGWHLVGDALDVTADLEKSVDGTTNVVTFGLADLADSGVGAALVKITRDAKGRVEGTEAASLADLADVSSAAPTDGQVLTYDSTNGWQPESFSGGSGTMTLVGAATVAGSAATSLTLSGLDLATDGRYVVYGNFANATGSAATISLFYNGDTTTTNYYLQFWQADGATNTPARNNSAALFSMNASSHLTMKADLLRDLAGYPRMTMQVNRHAPSAIALVQNAYIRNNTANVTSLTFSSSVAGALAVGSSFRVYKVS